MTLQEQVFGKRVRNEDKDYNYWLLQIERVRDNEDNKYTDESFCKEVSEFSQYKKLFTPKVGDSYLLADSIHTLNSIVKEKEEQK